MLSIIIYGRNDSHGYNYHKRLAISLNCIAEVLSDANDEIIFVDYNSAEDVPTILEAVSDTFTEKTKKRLKIFRIRPSECTLKNSALPGEPLSRNVAIRRSNPANKWILSTNVDMVFLPVDPKESLSSIVASLPEGFYELPRFELPENLWEAQFNRLQPAENLSFLRSHALNMQLNTIVRRPGFLAFDNPGDFQLMPRKTIFEIHGFNEQMRQGWHLDSNLCRRLSLYYEGKVSSLEEKLWGYHCNHTRQETPFHAQLSPENNWNVFVRDVKTPYLSEQSENWGLANQTIETVSLEKKAPIFAHEKQLPPSDFSIDQDSFNTLTYKSERIIAHLSDHFHHLPPGSQIAYVGHNTELLKLVREAFPSVLVNKDMDELYKQAVLMIFDFGFDQKSFKGAAIKPATQLYSQLRNELKDVMDAFLKVVRLEKKHRKQMKLIGINVLYTDFRALFNYHLSMKKTTFLTGISFGYVKQKKARKKAPKMWKKRLKFSLMYMTVRYFYHFTDRVRQTAYRMPLLKKVLQLK